MISDKKKTLILIPFAREFKSLGGPAMAKHYGVDKIQVGQVELWDFPCARVAICGQGKASAAVTLGCLSQGTDKAILLGSAGVIGDKPEDELLLLSATLEHDFLSFHPGKSYRKYPIYEYSPEVQEFLSSVIKESDISARKVSMFSGDRDVVSAEERKNLLERIQKDSPEQFASLENTILLSWESAGFCRAARMMNIPCGEVRICADVAEWKSTKDYLQIMDERMKPMQKLFKALVESIEN